MTDGSRKFAVVTGASTGIGYELARCCLEDGYDVLAVADEQQIYDAATALGRSDGNGARIEGFMTDLSSPEGVDQLVQQIGSRPVDALLANAGVGLGDAFLDQDFTDVLRVINTNITGTMQLIQKVGRKMRAAHAGSILVTGSIAGLIPGAFHAVYTGTKAFLDSFCYALREELKDTGVTVTCLMPGPTETEFFRRAGMLDTKVGVDAKQPAAEVARAGYQAMLEGDADVVTGLGNKVMAALSHLVPNTTLAGQSRKMAEPGTA